MTSPNFPEDYPNDALCQWKINAEEDGKIIIEFISFHVEESYDFLYIADSPNLEGASLVLTGLTNLEVAVSNEASMWITFTSDYIVARQGFALQLQWENITGM